MRIAVVFNRYLNRGGEEALFEAEAELLARNGHSVVRISAVPDDPRSVGVLGKARLAANLIWSTDWRRRMEALLTEHRPQLVHVHNVFPTMSPAIYYACKAAGVPVIQTLHNFRALCPAATCFRNGKPCEDCVGKRFPWPGVVHGCYRDSRLQTAVVAAMIGSHRLMGTWTNTVACYLALTEWARQKFIEGGLRADSVLVKPNFVDPDPGPGEHRGGSPIFVGRLTPEKGLGTLIGAWARLNGQRSLAVAGEGPLETLKQRSPPGVTWVGWRARNEVVAMMQAAPFLVFPSEWYEGFPLTIAEAFATGLPVIASRLGSMAEIVDDGRTGLHFTPGDPDDLAKKLHWAFEHPAEMLQMGRNARREFETKYTAERNYEALMAIYDRALERAKGGHG